MARARILVADDHEEIRNEIVQLLRRRFDVLGAVGDGPEFLEAVERLKPDLCVLDISMPNMSGSTMMFAALICISTSHMMPKVMAKPMATGNRLRAA